MAAMVSACNKDAENLPAAPAPHAPSTAALPKPGPTAAEQTAGMVQAATQGKSLLPMELKIELGSRPKVGEALAVNLALISQIDASTVNVKATGTGMTLTPEDSQFELPPAEAGNVYRHTLNLVPSADGVLILAVTVSVKHDEITDVRAFSIPIIAER